MRRFQLNFKALTASLVVLVVLITAVYIMTIPDVSIPSMSGELLPMAITNINPAHNTNDFDKMIPNDLIDRISVQSLNKLQQSYEQYSRVAMTIMMEQPSNVLVFGCGFDTYIYLYANKNGQTYILEDDLGWIKNAKSTIAKQNNMDLNYFNFEILPITFTTDAHKVSSLFHDQKKINLTQLDQVQYDRDIIDNVHWRVILVDGPLGHVHGRLQSMWIAYRNAIKTLNWYKENYKGDKDDIALHVFVHDTVKSRWEIWYAKLFFGENYTLLDRHYENEKAQGTFQNSMIYYRLNLEWLEQNTWEKKKESNHMEIEFFD